MRPIHDRPIHAAPISAATTRIPSAKDSGSRFIAAPFSVRNQNASAVGAEHDLLPTADALRHHFSLADATMFAAIAFHNGDRAPLLSAPHLIIQHHRFGVRSRDKLLALRLELADLGADLLALLEQGAEFRGARR